MVKVKNGGVVRRLSRRTLVRSRSRNIIAVCSIILTCLLFTGLLTVGLSMLDYTQEQTMRQVGTSAHAGLKFLTQEQFDKAAADEAVRDISYSIFAGELRNPELAKLYTELRYSEAKNAAWCFYAPTVGHLPQAQRELACSTLVLDALHVPHELGAQVQLDIAVGQRQYHDTFTLCGYWEGDVVNAAQTILVSRGYCEKLAPVPQGSFLDQEDASNIYGYLNPTIWFSSSWDIEGQLQALLERTGLEGLVLDGVNWAYGASAVDWQTVAFIVGLLALIVFSGYLIIYNIFSISVTRDIQFYGLLKTIGTTGRQLKRLVRYQALWLCCIGIPAGLLLGWLCGRSLLPAIVNATGYAQRVTRIHVSASPLIFLGGAALCLVTVYISCIRPCRMAARVSAMEAVGCTSGLKPLKRQTKKTAAVSPMSMARANLRRTPGRTRIVILSLCLSLTLLNCVCMLVGGVDMDKYLASNVVYDFMLTDATILNIGSEYTSYDSITDQDFQAASQLEGLERIGRLYLTNAYLHRTEAPPERLEGFLAHWQAAFPATYTQYALEAFEASGQLPCSLYGIDECIADKLAVYSGQVDWDAFSTGEYVLCSIYNAGERAPEDCSLFLPGQKVPVTWPDGTKKEYTVMAIANIPHAIGPRSTAILDTPLIFPNAEFGAHAMRTGALSLCLDVDDEHTEAAQQWMKTYCDSVNPILDFTSKQSYMEEFRGLTVMLSSVGGALTVMLGLIGILNFINACITSIHTRRQELAMLQSIGMTGVQLQKMLIWEGLGYIGYTLFLTATAGSLLCWGLGKLVSQTMWLFTYRFTLLPVLICAPALLLLAAAVPFFLYRGLRRDSVVERLRQAQ